MSKYFGKIIFENEGCEHWHEFETEAEAKAYVLGAKNGIQCADPDDDCHTVIHDQIEPTEVN